MCMNRLPRSIATIKAMHEINIFGDDRGLKNISLAHDGLLSKLVRIIAFQNLSTICILKNDRCEMQGAMSTKILRHAIIPSTSAGDYRFHKQVAFHLNIITKPAIEEKFGYTPTRSDAFDTRELKYELLGLALPNQVFSFSEHYLNIGDGPNLAAAYSAALRAATIPGDTQELGEPRVYLDSTLLHDQLIHINAAKESSDVLEVPIFFFATDLPEIYIDKYYTVRYGSMSCTLSSFN